MTQITSVRARQILDSRGFPTVEADVELSDGSQGRASVPSGASTGSHEAIEKRDKNPDEYLGKGVEGVVDEINQEFMGFLSQNDPFNQVGIDNELVLRDGTQNLSRLGANAILAVSLAVSKAAAAASSLPYYQYINNLYESVTGSPVEMRLPIPMFNIMNGGAHTHWQSTDIQEFMVVPVGAPNFSEAVRWGSEVFHHLQKVLVDAGFQTTVGDEGGFAPLLDKDETALSYIMEAIKQSGYKPGTEVALAIDAAASEWWKDDIYDLPRQQQKLHSQDLITQWGSWIEKYPFISIEDGLNEDDWAGWTNLNKALGQKIMLVGDDHLVTNTDRIARAIKEKSCNALLMKVNQIGTLTESFQAMKLAHEAGWKVIVSHRSGETEDTSIADIAVGTGAHFIKSGAPDRSERTAKYNQLLRIEEELTQKK